MIQQTTLDNSLLTHLHFPKLNLPLYNASTVLVHSDCLTPNYSLSGLQTLNWFLFVGEIVLQIQLFPQALSDLSQIERHGTHQEQRADKLAAKFCKPPHFSFQQLGKGPIYQALR